MSRSRDISGMPVCMVMCKSCPFRPDGDKGLRNTITARLLKVSQTCHSTGSVNNKPDTHICRGGAGLAIANHVPAWDNQGGNGRGVGCEMERDKSMNKKTTQRNSAFFIQLKTSGILRLIQGTGSQTRWAHADNLKDIKTDYPLNAPLKGFPERSGAELELKRLWSHNLYPKAKIIKIK